MKFLCSFNILDSLSVTSLQFQAAFIIDSMYVLKDFLSFISQKNQVFSNYNAKTKVRYITKESLAFRIKNICTVNSFFIFSNFDKHGNTQRFAKIKNFCT